MSSVGWGVAFVLGIVACGFPRPPDVAPDGSPIDSPGGPSCQLTGVDPPLANTDDSIMLEGTFPDVITVNFPGAMPVTVSVLGPHRAKVTVPASATAGGLTVTACGATLGPVPFRRTAFVTGIGQFTNYPDQATGAQFAPTLAMARDSHSATTIGSFVYVVGGESDNTSLSSVERARVNVDGSLGPFSTTPDTYLVTPRQSHAAVILGNSLYVLGGISNGRVLGTIERATIASDGSLGSFTAVLDTALSIPRYGHAVAVIGDSFYVIGGFGVNSLDSVERATINNDGSLGPFMPLSGVSLSAARHDHSVSVAGNFLYVVGGLRGNNTVGEVERSTIGADGSLGPFSTVSNVALMMPRYGHTATVLGGYLYVVGGSSNLNPIGSVERAPLPSSGAIGPFASVPITLTDEVRNHTATIIGNYIYVIGGFDFRPTDAIERASLDVSGSIGTFELNSGTKLTTGHYRHVTAAIGNNIYTVGGLGRDTLSTGVIKTLNTVEVAVANPDGSPTPFSTAQGLMLNTARYFHASATAKDHFYVIGGSQAGGGGLQSVEQATINADGTVGAFTTLIGATLVNGRACHTATILGNHLYVVGGASNTSVFNDVEQAIINPDGSIGTFSSVLNVTLVTGRQCHSTAVIGNYLYVIGGVRQLNIDNPLSSVERAPIGLGGELGTFATVSGVTLTQDRAFHTSAVIGSYLYVFGGTGDSFASLTSVERALINPDGTLGPFAVVPGVSSTTSRDRATTAILGNQVYVLGGYNGRLLDDVEQATLGP
jgi:N-acetylneuraminic acid mutarotase